MNSARPGNEVGLFNNWRCHTGRGEARYSSWYENRISTQKMDCVNTDHATSQTDDSGL